MALKETHTSVLIVGAGPVGLTLAIALGQQGIPCILVERKKKPEFLPKMERCNARTMEIFRRMGLSERIRARGFPQDVPMDVFIVRDLVSTPLLQLQYKSVEGLKAQGRETRDGSMPLEPYQLISQYTLEPLLKEVAEQLPSVQVVFDCELESFTQDTEGVQAIVHHAGERKTLSAQYLVGCDGGASTVRKQLGIALSGRGSISEQRQALFRCDDLFDRIPIGKGRHYHVADDMATAIVVQGDCKHFSLHSKIERDEDMPALFQKVVGFPVQAEMLYCGKWTQHLLVADRYSEGRVFIAGDAAHLVIPTGGLGMNTGIGDATDLAWKLVATLQGWGGPQLLASYATERREVGVRNVKGSGFASEGRGAWRKTWCPELWDDTDAGAAARAAMVKVADVEQRKTNEQKGTELGYRYSDSSVLWPEDGTPPEDDFLRYTPSTWPGMRVPHVWLDDGRALQDCMGAGFTLLRAGGMPVDTQALEALLAARGVPLTVLDIPDAGVRAAVERDVLLLRPDLHVAWRGDALPQDLQAVVDTVTGWAA